MTQSERFRATLLGEAADRFPYFDLEPDAAALRKWRRQGLPRLGSFAAYFQLELHHSVGLTLRSHPFYQKTEGILDDPSAFDRYYNPDQRARYTRNYQQRCRRLRRQGRVLYVDASGGGLLQMLGVGDWESLRAACYALVHRPREVERLVDRITDFYCVCLERVLARVTVDYASFYEPIASNTTPVVSPAMFTRFAVPGYRKVIDLLKRHRVALRILCSSGGNLTPLLPALIDAGINGLWISNIRSANMHYSELRRRFGEDIALIGGIDATVLTRDEMSIRRTVEATVPDLLAGGRYLPCLDDRPRGDMPFSHYRWYRHLLEEIAVRQSPAAR